MTRCQSASPRADDTVEVRDAAVGRSIWTPARADLRLAQNQNQTEPALVIGGSSGDRRRNARPRAAMADLEGGGAAWRRGKLILGALSKFVPGARPGEWVPEGPDVKAGAVGGQVDHGAPKKAVTK
jgi:hypothetical protein